MKCKAILFTIISVCLVFAICAVLLVTSSPFGVWINGISYIADHTDKYDHSYSVIDDTVEFSVNLQDPSSNVGKVIYQKDGCRIEIFDVDECTDNYRIFFKSYGDYSVRSATLISGVRHSATEKNTFTYDCVTALKLKSADELYDCSVAGESGINHKGGDIFGYYIFNNDYLSQQNSDRTDNTSEVILSLSGFIKNEWKIK
ncbi:MAG: hypothetical protein IJ011_09205 [Clostridia bacterium]|nr:hypothetical protein [Clostridia bacterium]